MEEVPPVWHGLALPRLRSLYIVLALVLLLLICARSSGDVLSLVAADAVVVAGARAGAVEVGLAQEISEKLRACGGPPDNLVSDREIVAALELAGYRHLILVGTPESNSVVGKCWGHFAAYPGAPWRDEFAPADTFFVFGYGDFRGDDVGYVECDQNPYWRKILSLGLPDPGFRLLIKLTGSGPAGVLSAGRAFLDRGLLCGVVPGAQGRESTSELWSLSVEQAQTEPPSWLTEANVSASDHRAQYVGWLMSDSTIYAGLRELGVQPLRVHRAKYVTEKGLHNFDASFHRRASANELMAILTVSAEDAASKLRAALGGQQDWKTVAETTWRGPKGTHIRCIGDYVIVESFEEPWGELALNALSHCPAGTGSPQ